MPLSYRAARNLGLGILLVIIFGESIFTYIIMAENAQRLTTIVTVDEVKLRKWHQVAETVAEAKNRLYDYRLGESGVLAHSDLLIQRAMQEVEEIRDMASDPDELATIDDLLDAARSFRQALAAYATEVQEGYAGGSSAREMEKLATRTADRIVRLGRNAAEYVGRRIEAKNKAILAVTEFSQGTLGAVLVLAVIATVVNAVGMARALARPVRQLVDATRRLAEGDLSHQVAIDSDDDIGELARSFNTMASRLRASQQALLVAKKFTDNIIRSMINTLVVANPDGSIRTVNRAICDLLGYQEAELVGQPLRMLFPEGFFQALGLDNLAERRSVSNVETVYRTRSGQRLRMLFSAAVIRDEEGQFEGIVCVAQDITLQAEAMRAGHMASLGEMAAGVAHEINNPINSIINFAQILLDEMEAGVPVSPDIAQRIIKEGDRVTVIVRSLLSFARESERVKKPVALAEIMTETLSLTEAQIKKDGIALTMEIPGDLPRVNGHFQQIQQVFINVINNARYALNRRFPGTHPDKTLAIRAQSLIVDGQPLVEISFQDQGTGIPAVILDKVVHPFFSTKPAGQGTGLGLTISHGIVTDHGGRLLIDSEEGTFTRVRILFPAADDEAEKPPRQAAAG
ncbi:MAG: HAMP domain-containing protein [Thermodesulfobacteriota bacterium]